MSSVNDYSSMIMFSDVMMASRPWNWTGSNNVTLDALGNLTAITGTPTIPVVTNDFAIDTQLPKGAYTFRCDGQATFFLANAGSNTLTGLSYNAGTNKTTGTLNYVGGGFWLGISAIPNPSTPPQKPQIIMPGYLTKFDSGDPFFDPFIKRLDGYLSCIRFMDYFATNGSPLMNWSDRTTPAHATQNRSQGASLEYAIQLCNKLGVDGWFNVPHMATDDFVQNMAELLLNNMDEGLTIWLEYSNETWNSAGAFPQGGYIADNIGAIVAPSEPRWKQTAIGYGKRTAEVFRIFQSVWTGANASRLKTVVNFQCGNTGLHGNVMSGYTDPTHGIPASYVTHIAIAPYFSGDINSFQLQGGGVDFQKVRDVLAMSDADCYASMRADFAIGGEIRNAILADITWKNANYPSKPHICYEMGQHLAVAGFLPTNVDENNQAVGTYVASAAGKIVAKWVHLNRQPEMKNVYAEYLQMFAEIMPNGLLNMFNYVGASDEAPLNANAFGTWGHQRGYNYPMSQNPKLAAVMEAAGVNPVDYD